MNVFCFILILFACETPDPVPLPPTAKLQTSPKKADVHRVKVGKMQGYLSRPATQENHEAVIIRVEHSGPTSRVLATTYPNETVLIIDTNQDLASAQKYLQGLERVTSVRVVCSSADCP
ncbi:MAG: hypothetical protein CL930_07445 [Deltaproteobacteria bacterium]|nr:hypothetical protein [Deltaproteobacteria bacterium]